MAYIRYSSRTVAIEVCLLFNFVVVFNFNVFRSLPSKAQFLGDVPMNRQNSANCSPRFDFVFCVMKGDRDSKGD